MKYRIIYDEKVIEYLEKLSDNISLRIINKIEISSYNPHYYFSKLRNMPEYKLRVGDYRIIAEINDNELIILVLYLDHRKRVYKRFPK